MTTAHRPTFDPARGREALRGPAYHQRLLPAHTVLKQRQRGQGGVGGLPEDPSGSRDLRSELLKAEASVRAKRNGQALPESDEETTAENGARAGEKRKAIGNGDMDGARGEGEEEREDPESKRRRLILEEAHDVDAASSSGSDSDPQSDSESDDGEDEEAELVRELNKIKAERAAQREKEEAERAAREQERREAEIARGNPLLNSDSGLPRDFGVKRRWDDDVVFKNQARGTEDRNKGKEFVNDLLRSDFHKKFMAKYVR